MTNQFIELDLSHKEQKIKIEDQGKDIDSLLSKISDMESKLGSEFLANYSGEVQRVRAKEEEMDLDIKELKESTTDIMAKVDLLYVMIISQILIFE
jgi:hypothetical protein